MVIWQWKIFSFDIIVLYFILGFFHKLGDSFIIEQVISDFSAKWLMDSVQIAYFDG